MFRITPASSVSHKLFAPRVGIAYRLGDKTVIRAGYGINYDPIPFSRPLRGWYPLVINQRQRRQRLRLGQHFRAGRSEYAGPDLSTGVVSSCRATSASAARTASFIAAMCSPGTSPSNASCRWTWLRRSPMWASHSVHLLADYDINAGYPGSGTTGLP